MKTPMNDFKEFLKKYWRELTILAMFLLIQSQIQDMTEQIDNAYDTASLAADYASEAADNASDAASNAEYCLYNY